MNKIKKSGRLAAVSGVALAALVATALVPNAAVADTGPGEAGYATASAQLVNLPQLLSGLTDAELANIKGAQLSVAPTMTDAEIQAQDPNINFVGAAKYETTELAKDLDLSALGAIDLDLPNLELGNVLNLSDILSLGAVTQYAKTSHYGSSIGYAGTVTDMASAISVGSGYRINTWDDNEPAAQLNLDAGAVSVNAEIGALFAIARDNQYLATPIHTTSYDVAGVNLKVGGSLIEGVLDTLNPLLSLLGVDLSSVGVIDFGSVTKSGDAFVTVSLDDLLEQHGVQSINDLPAGTNLLSVLPATVVGLITSVVGGIVDGLNLSSLPILGPVLDATLTSITNILNGLTSTLLTPLTTQLGALLALNVNVIDDTDGVISVTAVEANILNGTLTLPLATATAGANKASSLSSGAPTISGTAKVGNTLTANAGDGWIPADWHIESSSVWYTYQWTVAGKSIPGANKKTYTVKPEDAGKNIRVRVAIGHSFAKSAAAMSAPKAVAKQSITTSKTPVISGTPKVGQKLSLDFGTVSPTGTTPRISWYRDGKWVALANTYTVKASDVGHKITATWALTKTGYPELKGSTSAVTASK